MGVIKVQYSTFSIFGRQQQCKACGLGLIRKANRESTKYLSAGCLFQGCDCFIHSILYVSAETDVLSKLSGSVLTMTRYGSTAWCFLNQGHDNSTKVGQLFSCTSACQPPSIDPILMPDIHLAQSLPNHLNFSFLLAAVWQLYAPNNGSRRRVDPPSLRLRCRHVGIMPERNTKRNILHANPNRNPIRHVSTCPYKTSPLNDISHLNPSHF